jgi:hypothetical protein
MGKIYSNQPFKIELSYDSLPVTPVDIQIVSRNPVGTVAHFDASLDEVNKKIYYYSIEDETLAIAGAWAFWSKITDSLGQFYPGEPVTVQIYSEGE